MPASVIATVHALGRDVHKQLYFEHRHITDDLPSDVIGECVTAAVHRAYLDGHDPTVEPFCVVVLFSNSR